MSEDLSRFKIPSIFKSPFFCFLIHIFSPYLLSLSIPLPFLLLPLPFSLSFSFLPPSLFLSSSPNKKEALQLFVSLQQNDKSGKMTLLWLSKNKEQAVHPFPPIHPVLKGFTCLWETKKRVRNS